MKTLEQAIIENPEASIESLSEFYSSEAEISHHDSAEGKAERVKAGKKEYDILQELLSCEP